MPRRDTFVMASATLDQLISTQLLVRECVLGRVSLQKQDPSLSPPLAGPAGKLQKSTKVRLIHRAFLRPSSPAQATPTALFQHPLIMAMAPTWY